MYKTYNSDKIGTGKISTTGWSLTILLFFLVAFVFSNCDSPTRVPPPQNLSQLDWLLGTWEVNNGNYYQRWRKLDEQNYYARNFYIQNGIDTVVMENIDLTLREEKITYVLTVKTPQGDRLVPFAFSQIGENTFVFESSENPYPQKISYLKMNPDYVVVQMEGGNRKVKYDFKKLD